jgi:hypothetical protein
LKTVRFYAPTSWTGTVRAFADLHDIKPGAQAHVLSFGDFSLREQRKVTSSSAGGVEALPFKMTAKNWIPAYAGMTSTFGAPRHV